MPSSRASVVLVALLAAGCGLVSGLDSLTTDAATDASPNDVAVDQVVEDAPPLPDTGVDAAPRALTALSSAGACSTIANDPLSLSNSEFTIELWLLVRSAVVSVETDAILWRGGRTTSEPGWSLDITSGGIEFCVADASAAKCTAPYGVNVGDLLHVAVISTLQNGRTIGLYVRNASKKELTHSLHSLISFAAASWIASSSTVFSIGGVKANSCTSAPSMTIDDVRIYGTALQATQLESDVGTIPCNTAGLVSYFKFDEGTGSSAFDCSSAKLALSLGTGASFVTSPFP